MLKFKQILFPADFSPCVSHASKYSINKRLISVLLFLSLFSIALSGNFHSTADLPEKKCNFEGKRQIPFKLIRNKTILPVRVNDSRELNIILDTGMQTDGIVLFHKELGEELNLKGAQKMRISGAGKGKSTYAIRTESAKLSLSEVEFENQRVLVIQSDTMKGFPSDGVIGYTLFGSYVVKIDYDKKIINLIEPSEFEADSTWEAIDLSFKNKKKIPFLEAAVSINGEEENTLSLYVDLASSEAIELLIKSAMKFVLPADLTKKYLGRGLDGDIFGQFGKIDSLRIGSYVLRNVPAAFPKSEVRSRQKGADGILGNNALRRFNLIFDYSRNKLYIKPNSSFTVPF